MNRILALASIFISVFLLMPVRVNAATNTYYVTQNGNGARSGKSLSNAWSVSDFNSSSNWSSTDNSSKIDPGDTVYFSGMITSQVAPPKGYGGTSGNYITLDGWQGGTCNPVADHDAVSGGFTNEDNNKDLNACPSAAIVDLDDNYTNGITLKDNSYIIVQDFQVRDVAGGIFLRRTTGTQTHVIIRRNYIHDTFERGLNEEEAYPGYTYLTYGGANGDGNFIYNCSEKNKLVVKYDTNASPAYCGGMGDDLIVSYNEIGADYINDLASNNALSIYTGERQLIEYNTIYGPSPDACISSKEHGGRYKIFRFNKLFNGRYGISISCAFNSPFSEGNSDVYVYGNYAYNITDMAGGNEHTHGFRAFKYYNRIYFWANILSVGSERALEMEPSRDRTMGALHYYNNTIYKSGQNSGTGAGNRAGLFLYTNHTNTSLGFANNIFMDCGGSSDQTAIYNYNVRDSEILLFDYNLYYFTRDNPRVYWHGDYTIDGNLMAALTTPTPWGDNSQVIDPKFNDANGADNTDGTADDDFTLQPSSPAINTGKNLSACFDVSIQGKNYHMCLNDALDPRYTNWKTTPPTVRTTKQEDHGSWDRGAYTYTGDIPSAPISPPSALKILTNQ